MRRAVAALVLASAFFCASLVLPPAVRAADDPYADYRIPAHNWHSWSAGVTGSGDHVLSQSIDGTHGTFGSLNGSLSTRFDAGFDSDPGAGAYGLSLSVFGQRDHRDEELSDPFQTAERLDRFRQSRESVTGFFAFSRYLRSVPVGLALSSRQQLDLAQFWASSGATRSSGGFREESTENTTDGEYAVTFSGTAAVTLGRVRDATPVYQVQALEERLLEQGAIQRALSPVARERLAALYTTEARVAFAHQRPTKYFWGELERLLREDGVLSEAGLDAYTVQRLLEPLTIAGRTIARPRGFSVGPQVTARTSQSHRMIDQISSNALFQNDSLLFSSVFDPPAREFNSRGGDDILSGFFVDYHQPFGMHWQADATSQALVTSSGDRVTLATAIRGTWLVTDRWLGSASFNHGATAPGQGWDRTVDRWSVNYGASVSYFFEDSWAFVLGAQQRQNHDEGGFRREESFSLGLQYQISGLLNAPGLFAPMGLTAPAN